MPDPCGHGHGSDPECHRQRLTPPAPYKDRPNHLPSLAYLCGDLRNVAKVTVAIVALALLAGIITSVALAPFSGVDTLPPRCFALAGYDVSCRDEPAVAGAVAADAVVGVVLWRRLSR